MKCFSLNLGSVFMAVILIFISPVSLALADAEKKPAEVNIQLKDQVFQADLQLSGDQPPLIPLRELADSVGAKLVWEKETGIIYYFYGERAVAAHPLLGYIYIVDKDPADLGDIIEAEISSVLNYQVVEYPSPLITKNGITYVSSGFLSYLGMEAFWDESFSRLDINLDPIFYAGKAAPLSYYYVSRLLAEDVKEKLAALPQKIATFTTGFNAKDVNRTINIKLAAAALDGVAIEKGSSFSFNQAVGPRTPERGYLEAIIFVNDDKILGYGGGVCQVSSTLYNTALLAGLEILERHQHSLPVSYLPLGSEATVVYGTKDLVFRNGLDERIIIKCFVNTSSLTIEIWK